MARKEKLVPAAGKIKKATGDKPAKKKAVAAKKKTTRKRRTESASKVRVKAYWGVFNQSLKRVALFEYDNRKKALKMAAELTEQGKPHFVQPVKEAIDG